MSPTLPDSPYRVPTDGSFRVARAPTTPPSDVPARSKLRKRLKRSVKRFAELQRMLYAEDRHALLLVFQAMDAAGKDGTIRAVTSGVDPSGFQVFSFKQPSARELDHDFLWRTIRCLPERGRVGVFNRSYYEEVLVVRVHPEYLSAQRLPESTDLGGTDLERLWDQRFESIREHEQHLSRNGTVVLKFWLNVSKEEQRRRFLARIDVPEKNWKFSVSDVREREHWDTYMQAYEHALNATSTPWAPWFAVPADDKRFMRHVVADIVVRTLENLGLSYPVVDDAQRARLQEMRGLLDGG